MKVPKLLINQIIMNRKVILKENDISLLSFTPVQHTSLASFTSLCLCGLFSIQQVYFILILASSGKSIKIFGLNTF
jgi:hypothetical protein